MSLPLITDSHCHLDFSDFDDNLEETIENALRSGVGRIVTICTQLKDEPKVRNCKIVLQCIVAISPFGNRKS